jgi:hypothetical protein
MPGFKNDGGLQVNTRTLTIGPAAGGTGGFVYVAESFSPSRPAKIIETTDQNDEPSKQYAYAGFVAGTAVLQLSGSTAPLPQGGWEFTTILDRGGTPGPTPTAEIFFITDVGAPEAQGQEIKVNVSWRKKIN